MLAADTFTELQLLTSIDSERAVRLIPGLGGGAIIPGQASYHAHALAEQLRARDGRIDERIVTHAPSSPADEPGRFAHEACDVWEHLAWAARTAPD